MAKNEMMNPVAIRLLNQQLVAPQFSNPAELVSYMGAMQAQEYRMMRWAVEMRTRKPSAKTFKKAFDSGRIIRLHLMRGTWQLVSAEDYWPFITLCGPKSIAVTKGWMSSNKISIPNDELYRVCDILAQTAADKGSVTKEDIVQALAERDMKMDDHRLSYHIRMAEFTGMLCSGDLLPMKATYALTANKVKSQGAIDRDEALMRFTRKYFQSRQPATLEDFVWWSGLNVSDCRKGIALLGDSIHVEKWKGREFYLTDDCRTRSFRKGKFLLIPPYDEYLISYKSRDIVLPPEHRHHAHNNSGIFPDISNGRNSDFFFIKDEDPEQAARDIVNIVKNRIPKAYGYSTNDIQVLAPMQRSVVGATNLNIALQEAINPVGDSLSRGGFRYRRGDRVMQIRNNYDKDVFNGDIGTVEHVDMEERTLTVSFDGKSIEYEDSELDELTLAYATTIHKSQGSEYPVVVIPLLMTHFVMLQRNLVYTGITRAKKICIIVGTTKALAYAIHNMVVLKRNTRLKERLCEK